MQVISYAGGMLGRLYSDEVCSAARTLEVVGERWSLLIVRNAMFAGSSRFSEFQRGLGIAPNILSRRLANLVDAGVFELEGDGSSVRHSYVLTAKGLALQPVLLALTAWGDRWAAPAGRPITYVHEGCGGELALAMSCARCGQDPPYGAATARRNEQVFAAFASRG
jgi:DNA-binding HxlR family transcriptional regulator